MINIEVSIVLTKNTHHEKHLFNLEKLSGTQREWRCYNPSLAEFCMGRKVGLGLHTECCRLAVTGRRPPLLPHPAKPQCCFVVRLRPELQLLVRKCLRVTAACSAKSHLILLMDGWTDGCLVKAALSASFYGASEWWIALFLLSPNHHRSKPYFSGQKPSNIKTHNQVKLLAV